MFLSKKGSVSINVIIFIGALFPLAMFFFFDIHSLVLSRNIFKDYNDNIAFSAISSINKNYISQGILKIDESDARNIAEKLFISNYSLNEDFSITNFSPVKETPFFKIYVINDNMNNYFITDEGGEFFIKNPTVIIYTECKPRGIIVSRNIVLKNYSVYEVDFKNSPTQLIIPSENRDIDLTISLENIINPYRFNDTNLFNKIDWYFPIVPMSSGGSFVFSLKSDKYDIQNFEGDINFIGINKDFTPFTYSEEFNSEDNSNIFANIPETCPLNTTVSLSVYANAVNKETLETSTLCFPPDNDNVFIGKIENNINELLMFTKLK